MIKCLHPSKNPQEYRHPTTVNDCTAKQNGHIATQQAGIVDYVGPAAQQPCNPHRLGGYMPREAGEGALIGT